MTSNRPSCRHCGKPIPDKVSYGVCPACLMKVGLGTSRVAKASDGPTSLPHSRGFTPPAPEELSSHFPQLEVLGIIGQGGMGVVYRARQKQLNRLVALKILPDDANDPAFAERFAREAQAMAQLTHPNIITVHDFGHTPGHYYFVMEYVEGMNLRQLMQACRPSSGEVLPIVQQVCEGLQYAHDQGIVHRDIKPENILVNEAGRVKIADFGLAKMTRPSPLTPRLTQIREVMGTPHYMAPEQLEKPLEVDHRADLYSLGVVFYELLTGELPLGRFQPPSKKASTDGRLDGVILRALQKEPELRYQEALHVRTDVIAIRAKLDQTGRQLNSTPLEAGELSSSSETSASEDQVPLRTAARRQRLIVRVVLPLGFLLSLAILLIEINHPGQVWRLRQTWTRGSLSERIPPREPDASDGLIDLSAHYNATLSDNWHDPGARGNNLEQLPTGLQTMAGTQFDVRGLIQLCHDCSRGYPSRVDVIPVNQTCQELHFLHAAGNALYTAGDPEIGRYIVHYADGDRREIPIRIGQEVADWWASEKDRPYVIAWVGENPETRRRGKGDRIRLYKTSWPNPLPNVPIAAIDFILVGEGPAVPFLVAITAE